jgi:hypothetical protein
MKGGGKGILSILGLLLYIFLKYPVKYGVLYGIFMVMVKLFKQMYLYICKAIQKFASFFKIITNPQDIDLIVLKVFNVFRLLTAFIDLFIGLIFLCIAFVFFILLGLVSVPFNIIFAL